MGIFPIENGNRENGQENTPTVSVPVPALPVLFSHFPIFLPETVYDRFINGADWDGIFPSRFQL